MKRTLVAVALAVVMIMALAAPALAQSIMHSATYEMDGTISLKKQAGHLCNTGAEVKQTINGNGVMDKVQTVNMEAGIITMDDQNDWIAGATALTVTTVWELCSPPKYTYDTDTELGEAVVHPGAMYVVDEPLVWGPMGLVGMNIRDWADLMEWDAVSDQIWAVQVQADPGYSGNLHQSGEAAYGAFQAGPALDADDEFILDDDKWGWDDGMASWDAEVGPDYVGNYFTMDQMARTSMGTVKRYIDISSPFSHGYLMEDMSVTGKSQIEESFVMANLPKGSDIVGLWWDLF